MIPCYSYGVLRTVLHINNVLDIIVENATLLARSFKHAGANGIPSNDERGPMAVPGLPVFLIYPRCQANDIRMLAVLFPPA